MFDPIEAGTDLFTVANVAIIACFLLVLPALLFTQWVNGRFQRVFAYFMQVASSSGLTGLDIAHRLLQHAGVSSVRVVPGTGVPMRNHYHPLTREITLAHAVCTSCSVSALGIAAHEVGHAVQHARGYWPVWLRTALVPLTNLCFIIGIGTTAFGLLAGPSVLLWASVGLFAFCLLFYLVTLPVEFDASVRARTLAIEAGILQPEEREGMDRVLRTASLTYVGRAVQSGCGVLALGLLLGTWHGDGALDALDGAGEFSFWLTGIVQVVAVMALFSYRKRAPVGRGMPQAVELNNAGNLLVAQNDLAGAIDMFTQAIRLAPGLAQAYCNRGSCYSQAGRLDDALADLNQAVRLAPTAADPRLSRAHIRAMRKEYEAALADCDEVLRQVPENRATVRLHQGNVWLDMGEYERAIEAFTEAVDQGGHWPLARCNRALAYLRQGDLRRALADCDEAIRLAPELAVAYNNRGTVLTKLGDYAAALADLRTANRLDPQLPNVYKNLAWLQATCPEAGFRNGAEAVANAVRAIQRAGNEGREWLDIRAAGHAEAGQFDLAVRYQAEMVTHCMPSCRAEQEARLELYRAGRPYRVQPAATMEFSAVQQTGPE
jgi:Zn-dependent membrane protease YugP/tetratricopeptide (TPR) repeat protein